jgi:hypothetical protein
MVFPATAVSELKTGNWKLATGGCLSAAFLHFLCVPCAQSVELIQQTVQPTQPRNPDESPASGLQPHPVNFLDPCQSVKIRGKDFPQLHQKY